MLQAKTRPSIIGNPLLLLFCKGGESFKTGRLKDTQQSYQAHDNRLISAGKSYHGGERRKKSLQIRRGQFTKARLKLFRKILHCVNTDSGGGGFHAAHAPLFEQLAGVVEENFLKILIGG